MKNLQQINNNAGPNIRIGGNSADTSWFSDNPNDPLPKNITYRITSEQWRTGSKVLNGYTSCAGNDLRSYLAAVPQWNGTVTIDVNFRQAADPSWAVNHITAVNTIIPWSLVDGIEIGNECDLYHENGIRTPNFTYTQYDPEFGAYAKVLRILARLVLGLIPLGALQAVAGAGMPTPRIQGATWCCSTFDASLQAYAKKYTPATLKSFSYHQ
jgi:hypothetical protein